ncbi:DeoR/GlpR family DNA-binding transcription regulator [Feifania hominis]|uniref:DeoR/GlpR transcriptional regulator n=1 Tax=Feifania hominis TaxID=2763660 RepID=A0A926HVE3_9FIRM|nr:DeoR/GlpR family DNA-binding transcription regulator [Feifania hominis]MBC8536900.1 DeoR/GlpR transcriptional regulator [Feifania hominis]
MFRQERQERILQYINIHKRVTVKELAKIFKTSVVTIRSDITELDNNGLVVKMHGGAIAITDRYNLEIPSKNKARQNTAAKRSIGQLAAGLVEENDIVILDSGSTALEVAKHLRHKRITVITTDLQIGAFLASVNHGDITLIITGGTVEPNTYTQCGVETLSFLRRFHVNKLFLGCDALDPIKGMSNRTLIEAEIKRAMIEAAEQVIAVADSTKHNREVFVHVCDTDAIDILVTDKITKSNCEAFERIGVRVMTSNGAELSDRGGTNICWKE